MADMETIVKGLYDIAGFIAGRIGIEQSRNFLRTIDDAIAMLKKQIPIAPIKGEHGECPICGYKKADYKYCPNCGQTFDWGL